MAVSVITPNRNNAPYLKQCLASVAEDPAVTEIVIRDNASSDDSVAVIRGLDTPKIRLIEGSSDIGTARARDEAIRAASNGFLYFLDSDDYLAPLTVSHGLKALRDNRWDLAVPEMRRVSQDGSTEWPFLAPPTEPVNGHEAFMRTVGTWQIHVMGVLSRRAYDLAARDFTFRGYCDDELLTRRTLLNCRAVGPSQGTYYYRQIAKILPARDQLYRTLAEVKVLRMASELGNVAERRRVTALATRAAIQLVRQWAGAGPEMSDLFRELGDEIAAIRRTSSAHAAIQLPLSKLFRSRLNDPIRSLRYRIRRK